MGVLSVCVGLDAELRVTRNDRLGNGVLLNPRFGSVSLHSETLTHTHTHTQDTTFTHSQHTLTPAARSAAAAEPALRHPLSHTHTYAHTQTKHNFHTHTHHTLTPAPRSAAASVPAPRLNACPEIDDCVNGHLLWYPRVADKHHRYAYLAYLIPINTIYTGMHT